MNFKKKVINFKLINISIVISILIQTFLPIVISSKSYASSESNVIQGEIAKVTINSPVQTLNEGDTVPVEIKIEGNNIVTFMCWLNYDKNVFEEIQESDIIYKTGWSNQGFGEDDTGLYIYCMENSQTGTGTDSFVVFTINMKVKATTDVTTLNFVQVNFSNTNSKTDAGPDDMGYTLDVVIPNSTKQKSTLTVDPNGGIWEESSNSQEFTEELGKTKIINEPTSTPNANVIKFNGNGGTTTKLQETQSTTFSGWTGATLNGNTYTFEENDMTIKANYTGNSIFLPSANKIGSTFLGWSTDTEGKNIIGVAGDIYTPSYTKPNAVITLFAQYQEDIYTLTIDPNGGKYNGITANTSIEGTYNSNTTITNPTEPNGYTVTLNNEGTTSSIVQTKTFKQWNIVSGNGALEGTTYTFGTQNGKIQAQYDTNNVILSTPTKIGYTFEGWYTEATGGTKITSPYMPTSDITLYAHWTAKTYTITFNPGEGTVSPTTKTVTYNQTYGTLPTPTREGYDFNGWKDFNGNTIKETDKVNITENATLIASWLGTEYTVTFDPDRGQVNTTSKQVRNEGKYGELPTPIKQGYIFKGWYNSNNQKIESTNTVNLTANETLSAKWEAKTYTITFDAGENGIVNETTRKVKYQDTYGTLPTASKTGHTFKGWFNINGQEVQGTQIVNTTANITLYAKYDINKYKVTFKNDDGTIIDTIDVEYGKDAQYTKETPVKNNVLPGYEATFKGWQDASKLSNITKDEIVTATYTISPKVYTITYNNIKDSDNSINPTTYTINDSNIVLSDLPNQGKYVFKGWYTSNGETGIKVTSIDTSKLENIILYAQWENDSLYFKSKKYKVGENDIDNYENGDIYLNKIVPETKLSDFINNCDTNGRITVINESGQALSNEDLVGTNMQVKVVRKDEEISMTIVVMGDIDGDGKTTAQDLSETNKACLGISEVKLTGARFKAADIDDNGKITATDLSEINRASLGISKLIYIKPNKQ